MDLEALLLPFDTLGFYLVEVENSDMLFYDLEENSLYATVNNLDGYIPNSLDEPIIWALFDNDDCLQWSVTLDSSHQLFDLMNQSECNEELLSILYRLREENIANDESSY